MDARTALPMAKTTPPRDFAHERMAAGLYRVLARFRDQHPEMSVQQAMFFLHIALNPGTTVGDAATASGMSDSNASRAGLLMSEIGLRGVQGFRWIEQTTDPMDRRKKRYALAPRGERLLADIDDDLDRGR